MEQKNALITTTLEGRTARIVLSGYITPEDNAAIQICRAMDECEPNCDRIEMVLLNCFGGVIFEGIGIRNRMKASKVPVDTKADGLVASMAAVLYAAGRNKQMARAARLLFHRAKSAASGTADDLRDAGNQVDDLEKDVIQCLCDDLNLTEEVVRKELMPTSGKDVVITASSAGKYNLITSGPTGVYDGVIKNECPIEVVMMSDDKAIYNYYQEQLDKSKTEDTMKNLALFVAALAITDPNVNEETVLAATQKMADELKRLRDENEKLRNAAAAHMTAAIDQLVDGAIKQGKILEAQRETYKSLAKADLNATKNALDSMPAHESAADKIAANMKREITQDEKYKDFTFRDFQEKAPQVLEKMQKSDPERFKKLKDEYLASR